jgi:hypothetical protein
VGTCDVEPTRFEVGGELFTVASARSRRKLKRLARDAHGAVTVREDFEAQISFIGSLLIESDQSRWHNLCERTEDPVPAFLFPRIFDWLLEVVEPEFAQTLPKATARFNRRGGSASAAVDATIVRTSFGILLVEPHARPHDAHPPPCRDGLPGHAGRTRPRTR